MNYDYYELIDGERQYDDTNVTVGPVEARYIHVEGYEGNRLIEALPRPRNLDEVKLAYSAGIPGYRQEKIADMDKVDALTQLTKIKAWRFPLKYNVRLEQQFYISQIISYAGRAPVILTAKDGTRVIRFDPPGSAANEAFSLIGYSGSGKSTSITQLLKDYPQVIEHTMDKGERFLQITYVLVTCPVNSNMRALMDSIAAAVDRALGFAEPVYGEDCKKLRSVGTKADLISELCRKFSIGTIFIDEIQYMDFTSNKESSFNSLLTVVNDSGVNISVIGTEEAYRSMFKTLKMERRTGKIIEADSYCKDKKYFATLAKDLMRYQWFGEYVEPSEELIESLYTATGGVIDLLVTYWMYMNYEAIQTGKRKKIDSAYVQEITDRHFGRLPKILKDMAKSEADQNVRELIQKAMSEIDSQIAQEQENAAVQDIMDSAGSGEIAERNMVRSNAIQNILITCKATGSTFTEAQADQAVSHVMGLKKNLHADEVTISQEAYNWLLINHSSNAGKRKTKKLKKDDPEYVEIKAELLQNTAAPGESK